MITKWMLNILTYTTLIKRLSKKNEIGRDFDKERPLQNELLSQQGAEKSLKAILICHTSHF